MRETFYKKVLSRVFPNLLESIHEARINVMGIKEDLDQLDAKISRLKVEYEQYFMRVLKREPLKMREEVERIIYTYSNKAISNTSFKFRFNSLVSKYTSYKQYWIRVLRAIDEGTYVRKAEGSIFGAPPAETDRQGGFVPSKGPAKSEAPEASAAPSGVKGSDDIAEVYNKYIEARRACNEPVDGITPDTLARTIEQYRKKVEEQYKTTDIEFKVQIKDGKTKLTITPKGKA